MFRLLLLTLVGLIGLLLVGCVAVGGRERVRGSGMVTAEERTVAPFTAVDVAGIGELVVTQGEAEHLTVETDDNLHAVVVSEVRDGWRPSGAARFFLYRHMNTAYDHHRRRRRCLSIPLTEGLLERMQSPPPGAAAEEREPIERALSSLPGNGIGKPIQS